MRIKNYKDLVGLSIAQARAVFHAIEQRETDLEDSVQFWSTHAESVAFEGTKAADLHSTAFKELENTRAEVDRLTKVIASYDTLDDLELRTARDFIKAFNIDVEKMQTERAVQLGREIMDEDAPIFEALAKSEAEDRKAQATLEKVPIKEEPSTDSLQKVWKAINGTRRGRPAEISKWTRRRLAQLTRLEELGHAFKAPSGSWWARDPGPQENDR